MQKTYEGRISLRFMNKPHAPTWKHDQNLAALGFAGEVERVSSLHKRSGKMLDRRLVITCYGFLTPGTFLGKSTEEVVAKLEQAAKDGFLVAYDTEYQTGAGAFTGRQLTKVLTDIGRADLTAIIAHPDAAAKKAFGVE